MRKPIGNRFKCLKNVVRIIVVRVLRGFRHNLGYDLGNPRAASAGAHGPITFEHHRTVTHRIAACSALPRRVMCALAALAVRVRSAITQTLSSTTQQTETSMTDPQTTDAQTDATSQTTNTDAATDAAPAQAETQETRDLDFVFEQYEAALVDFKDKLDQANAAKATAISAAQRVADLKKELDTLEGDVEKSFASVEAFLASA